jgi:hypothetical protein
LRLNNNYSAYWEEIFLRQTTWCCECAESLAIDFVMHLGDVVQHGNRRPLQWEAAKAALLQLERCNMPYSVLPGNHDYKGNDYSLYDKSVRLPDAAGKRNNRNRNTYYIVPDGFGGSLLLLSLQYELSSVESWASSVLSEHSGLPAIVASHYVTSDCSDSVSSAIRRLMQQHCNLMLAVGGHVFGCGGEDVSPVLNSCNQTRAAIVTDYQGRNRGGSGWLRYYRFSSDLRKLCAYTYSPWLREYETDANSYFSLSLETGEMGPGCPADKPCASTYVPMGFVLGIFYVLAMDFALLATFLGRTQFSRDVDGFLLK